MGHQGPCSSCSRKTARCRAGLFGRRRQSLRSFGESPDDLPRQHATTTASRVTCGTILSIMRVGPSALCFSCSVAAIFVDRWPSPVSSHLTMNHDCSLFITARSPDSSSSTISPARPKDGQCRSRRHPDHVRRSPRRQPIIDRYPGKRRSRTRILPASADGPAAPPRSPSRMTTPFRLLPVTCADFLEGGSIPGGGHGLIRAHAKTNTTTLVTSRRPMIS